MSNQFSLYNRPAARRLIVTLVAIELILIVAGYGLLGFYALQQQQQLGKSYLIELVDKLNHKISHHEYDWSQVTLDHHAVIKNYQLIIVEPTGATTVVKNNHDDFSVPLPNWTLSNKQSNKMFYDIHGFEVWQNLAAGYRLYVKVQYFPLWRNFANPIYLLPLLLGLCLFLYVMIQLRKVYDVWDKFLDYAQNLQLQISQGYQPAKLHEFRDHPESRYLAQLFNRYAYKMGQYYDKVRELTYRQNILIDTSPILLFIMSRNGRIVYFNHKFSQVFYTPFQPGSMYILSDFITGANKTTQQLLNSLENIQTYATLPVTNLQRNLYFDLRITPYYNRFGQLQGYSCGLQDTTDYHDKLQKAWVEDKFTTDKLTNFNKMWAVVGHELRTPLSGLVGMIDLLAEDKAQFNSEQQETIATLQQSSYTMIQLLNDMLDVAKLDAGRLQTNVTSIDLLQLLRQTTGLMVGNARRQKISLYIFVDPFTPRFIDCDEGKLRQIILNLLTNAVKFTKEGYVAITVDKTDSRHPLIAAKTSQNMTVSKDWLKITVKDTGLGISEKDQQKLFSYFEQANDSISRQFGGTGLGLAISNSFSHLLGGFIHLESQFGQGSEFQLFLPIPKFSLQPVYQHKTRNLRVTLILISPFSIFERANKVLSYVELSHHIFTTIDETVINTINNLNLQGLVPVFVIDDAALKANNHLLNNIHFYNDAIKIILSIESPKTLPPELQLQFDGYLQKPASLSLLIAEVNHLYELKIKKEKTNTHLPVQLAFKQFLQQYPNPSNSSVNVASVTPPVNNPNLLLDGPIQVVDEGHTNLESPNDAHSSSQKLILIAEDNPVNQKIAKKHLEALGYRYLVASDGEQAVKLLSENRQQIGLVLMDCRMPILDGIEATRIIRLNKDSVPIVALTANDSDDDKNICLEAGMDSFLTKPINKQKLIEAINHYMV
ncbi:response regulator [Moraxella sp. DOX410]|nr:response regulator [Moraxella sp. DOX410]WNP27527.1 response regulator [Moraxella sp. DOX410]